MNVYDLSAWYDPAGAVILFGTMALILLWCVVKLITPRWDDWLDERWGRGSIRDTWRLSEIEDEAAADEDTPRRGDAVRHKGG
jgi:hypothetical protein